MIIIIIVVVSNLLVALLGQNNPLSFLIAVVASKVSRNMKMPNK